MTRGVEEVEHSIYHALLLVGAPAADCHARAEVTGGGGQCRVVDIISFGVLDFISRDVHRQRRRAFSLSVS